MSKPPPLPPKPHTHHPSGADEGTAANRVTISSNVAHAIAAQAAKMQLQSPGSADAHPSSAAQCGIGIVLRASKKTPPDPFVKIEVNPPALQPLSPSFILWAERGHRRPRVQGRREVQRSHHQHRRCRHA
jgi:hypothetical protein